MAGVERGCLPCTNCVVTVQQDKYVAAESFGSYSKTLKPGLGFAGCDCMGMCITLRSISSRIESIHVGVPTKTKDSTFCSVQVVVQYTVDSQNCEAAIYKLADVRAQIQSFASDVVRSKVPTMELHEAFEAKDDISNALKDSLASQLAEYGWSILDVLVTEIKLAADVVESMNEINRQRRLKEASEMKAEADKIRVVAAAQASADAAKLSGEGVARQRSAIVDGLRKSVAEGSDRTISAEDATELMLVTQYFDTLRQIGQSDNCKTYFLPKHDPDDRAVQMRLGWLQAKAAMDHINGPSQQRMRGYDSRSQSPAPRTSLKSLKSSATGLPDISDFGTRSQSPSPAPAPQRRSTRLSSRSASPAATAPPRFSSRPEPALRQQLLAPVPAYQPQVLQIQVPPGAQPGQILQVQAPDGRMVQVAIPPGAAPNSLLQIQV
eukprot:TRINITY_DN28617_c0_g1_i1.p1 TRINITY_DN28617_c0_g1~~TRINITY_DN28617_c0_g1_i1.p1  ORF type:complete len:436 (-),score=89.72 TRINITY_DN28617_c0_g1_i1:67-1374(-)